MHNKPVSLVITSSQTSSLQKPLLPDSFALTQNLYCVNGYRPRISFSNSVSSSGSMVQFEICLPIDSSTFMNMQLPTKSQIYFDVYWFQKCFFIINSNYS